MQLASIAVTLRRRSPWEAIDLGFAMLRQWWRPVYASWALLFAPIAVASAAIGWMSGRFWIASLMIWWLKPLYDRLLLHVLSRAVFGEVISARTALAAAREWLATGLLGALTIFRFDAVRSFSLPVRQLEGQSGRQARARVALLSRRARSYAYWLTVVCMHFEAVFLLSGDSLLGLLMPAQADHAANFLDLWRNAGDAEVWSLSDVVAYAVVVSIVEPCYVAAGFALYHNRRTLLEGWDLEVALRSIAERTVSAPARALATAVLAMAVLLVAPPRDALAEQASQKDPRAEIRVVMSAPEFQQYRDTKRWARIETPSPETPMDLTFLRAIGYALAKSAEVFLWIGAVILVVLALWWIRRTLPRLLEPAREAYRPPPTLFGLEVSPETLPEDIPAAAAALAREGRLREALGLLYRGSLFELVHRRGVEMSESDTEEEALRCAAPVLSARAGPYLARLVTAWQAAAYAQRLPARDAVESLALDFHVMTETG